MSFIQSMNQLMRFLANPHFDGEFKKPSFLDLFLPLVSYFILVIPIGVLLLTLSNILEFSMKTFNVSYYQRVFYGLVLGPFVEEIYFRLIYVFNKRNLSIVFCTSLILTIFFIVKAEPIKAYVFIAISLIYCLLLLSFARISRIISTYFKIFFYCLAMVFAFLHLSNFSGVNSLEYLLAIFIIIPQFILGIILGYLRLNYGFIYAVGFHMMVNISIVF